MPITDESPGGVPTAPAFLRGFQDISLSPGVIVGSGLSGTQQTANGIALQAAITSAVSAGKRIELPPGTYEFNLAGGLVHPYNSFGQHGTKQSILKQFAVSSPILSMGSLSSSNGSFEAEYDGMNLQYGVDQTGQTGANAFVANSAAWSKFKNIACGDGGSFRPWRGIYIPSNASFGFFSNSLEDIQSIGAQQSCVDIQENGTGNRWANLYMSVGSASGGPLACAGPVFNLSTGSSDDSTYEQVNAEWAICQNVFYMQLARSIRMGSVHVEYSQGNGFGSSIFFLSLSTLQVDSLMLRTPNFNTAQGASTFGSIVQGFSQFSALLNNVTLHWEKVIAQNPLNLPLQLLIHTTGTQTAQPPIVQINNFQMDGPDTAGAAPYLYLTDAYKDTASGTASAYGFPVLAKSITFEHQIAKTEGATFNPVSDIIVYGVHEIPCIVYPATLGAARTVTLWNTLAITGNVLANTPVRTGSIARVVRSPGTADGFNLVVKDFSGTILQTISTANVVAWFRFNGTNWVTA